MATMTKLSARSANSITGLIPAAGRGSRLPNLPCSKELLPVPGANGTRVRPAIEHSVSFLLDCGVEQQHVVIAPSKKDIPDALGDGNRLGARIAYTEISDSPGVPWSLDAALCEMDPANVILVFPDIMFEPLAEIAEFLAGIDTREADVLLALVPSTRGDKVDIVAIDDDGRVTDIVPKPGAGRGGWTWVAAAWSPAFSLFLHEYLQDGPGGEGTGDREIYAGDVINAAIAAGLPVMAKTFAEGKAIDIGTPDDLAAAWRRSQQEPPAAVAGVLRGF